MAWKAEYIWNYQKEDERMGGGGIHQQNVEKKQEDKKINFYFMTLKWPLKKDVC